MIYRELWGYDRKVIFCSAAEVLFEVLVSFGAVLLPALIVGMLESRAPIGRIAGVIGLIFVLYAGVSYLAMYLKTRNLMQFISFRSIYMEMKNLSKIGELDYFQYENSETQKLCLKAESAFDGNNDGLEGILHNDVAVASALLSLILYTVLISGVSPWIVAMLLLISVLQLISFRLANRCEVKNKDKKAEYNVTQNYLRRQAFDVPAGKDIRLYQLKDWLTRNYVAVNQKYRKLVAKEKRHYFANDLFGLFLQLGRDAVCYGYFIYQLKNGMAVSQFVLYIGMIGSFSGYFTQITEKLAETVRFHKDVGFFREFMDTKPEFHHGEGTVLKGDNQALRVEFSNVSFSYPGSKEKVLDDISFTIEKGEKLALVGMNGAGKSTIVKLICGFYRPDSGSIFINGVDMAMLDLEEYYQLLSVVFQESFIYSFSIADNVSCSREEEIDPVRCTEALKKAGLWEKVAGLKEKERTYLNKDIKEDGIRLSGGELQKLILARALYKEFGMILLDEPTAALDAIAESEMYEKYGRLIDGKTALFISHRLASTRFCDKILLLEDGKIKECGTHEELMKLQGAYAGMFEIQSRYYKEDNGNENKADLAGTD